MDSLLREHEKLLKGGSLSKSIEDVQQTIDLLIKARDAISAAPPSASVTLAKLQNPVKHAFEAVHGDIKEVYKVLRDHGLFLDKLKGVHVPPDGYEALSSQPALLNRAIGMHFLREGQFFVASAFLAEAMTAVGGIATLSEGLSQANFDQDFGLETLRSEALRKQFATMYHILDEMKTKQNLLPAILWSREHRQSLEARGSNLEFELERLQFIWLFQGASSIAATSMLERQRTALHYAGQTFGVFQERYLRDIQQLIGAMAFCPNLQTSPYRHIFLDDNAWEHLAMTFTREFCSLLGLSADSPIFVTTTAGAIALPTLQKLQVIMKEKRTEWTSENELPVEVPLPPAYRFHSIFVCPVSKEQTTDQNPPVMMPCGHVIAQESLFRLSKGNRFKCPYCPNESHPRDARKLFL